MDLCLRNGARVCGRWDLGTVGTDIFLSPLMFASFGLFKIFSSSPIGVLRSVFFVLIAVESMGFIPGKIVTSPLLLSVAGLHDVGGLGALVLGTGCSSPMAPSSEKLHRIQVLIL